MINIEKQAKIFSNQLYGSKEWNPGEDMLAKAFIAGANYFKTQLENMTSIAEYEDLLKWHKGELPQITKKNKETLYLAWTKYGRAGSPCIVTPLKEKYMNLWTGAIVDKEDVVSWKEIELPTE